jgi:hypothetical protein
MFLRSILVILCFWGSVLDAKLTSSQKSSFEKRKYVIGLHSPGTGLFALFLTVLNHLQWCEKNKKVPVVYWDTSCLYHIPKGYNGSLNVWEYYFEPLSLLSYKSGDTVYKTFFGGPDGSEGTTTGFSLPFSCLDAVKKKLEIHKLVQKYIKIKHPIKKKIDRFFKENIAGKKTIGIHVRGTDKFRETTIVPLSLILQEANKYQGYQFLVATDEEAILEQAKKVLKGKVIYYPAERSKDGKPLHFKQDKNNALRGEEVLIEVQLLARCDKVIHTCSNVSFAVHLFNPYLESILFHPSKEKYLIKGDQYKKLP